MDDAKKALASLRAEVDRIDGELGALLARRFAQTGEIGRLKALAGEAPVDPERQRQRRQVLDAVAARCGLPPEMWADIQRRISAEVVRRHAQAGCKPA